MARLPTSRGPVDPRRDEGTVSDPESTLLSTRWCRRGAAVPTGTTGRDTQSVVYTFAADGSYRVEQFVEHDPGVLQSRTIVRTAGLSADGVWKVEAGKALLSPDRRNWLPIEILPDNRIRIGEDEYVPYGGPGAVGAWHR
jgi:hypothetical protein